LGCPRPARRGDLGGSLFISPPDLSNERDLSALKAKSFIRLKNLGKCNLRDGA
jgi:hypothetical protein